MMSAKQYAKREALGIILTPIVIVAIVVFLNVFHILEEEVQKYVNIAAAITCTAALIAFGISHVLVFRKRAFK